MTTTPSPDNRAPTLARLAKELNGYARHRFDCPQSMHLYERFTIICTCGLTALQQQLAEELAKGGEE